MGSNFNICKCECGCTNKFEIPYDDKDITGMLQLAVAGIDCSDRINRCVDCLNGKHKENDAESPIEVLKLRLARGEINEEEYYRLKSIIENNENYDS